MLGTYALLAVSAFIIVSALYMFLGKRLIHAVVALALAFTGTAAALLVIGQTVMAMLMMLVFVGGLSTYLVVAVAADERSARMLRVPYFIVALSAMLVAVVMVAGQLPSGAVRPGSAFLSSIPSALSGQYATFYVIAALLFGTLISGVLVIRRFSKLLV